MQINRGDIKGKTLYYKNNVYSILHKISNYNNNILHIRLKKEISLVSHEKYLKNYLN